MDDALRVARLTVARSADDDANAGPIFFELRYGGVAIATSTLLAGRHERVLDVPGLADWMDDRALTVRAWSDGGPTPIRAACVRGTYRTTAAEEKARSQWSGVKGRGTIPDPVPALVDSMRPALAPRSRSARQVAVYEGTERLLLRRRTHLTRGRRSPRIRRRVASEAPVSR